MSRWSRRATTAATPRNKRVLLAEYSRKRGQISAGNQVVANSTETDTRLRYQRNYPRGRGLRADHRLLLGQPRHQRHRARRRRRPQRQRRPALRAAALRPHHRQGSQRRQHPADDRPRRQKVAFDQLSKKGYSAPSSRSSPPPGRSSRWRPPRRTIPDRWPRTTRPRRTPRSRRSTPPILRCCSTGRSRRPTRRVPRSS